MIVVIRKPEMTKKTSTPVKPPGRRLGKAWNASTEHTATARRPSMSARYGMSCALRTGSSGFQPGGSGWQAPPWPQSDGGKSLVGLVTRDGLEPSTQRSRVRLMSNPPAAKIRQRTKDTRLEGNE